MNFIPYGRQDIDQTDIDAVISVLRSDFLTQGPVVPAFEESVINYCNVQYAIAVSSATSALHIACLALGLKEGDIVWTSPITFVATANCALYCGASIDFVDIDSHTYNLSIERLTEKLIQAEKIGKLPKILIPVHLCGQACDMLSIYNLSLKYGFKIIEDASHAIGGRYKNKLIGNCQFSDITIFSFHPVKIITTGEGGMAVTNNAQLAKNLRLFRSHGITNTMADMKSRPLDEIWNYQQIDLGFHYRMTDIHAALGLSQMSRLNSFVEKRRSIAKRYDDNLAGLPIQLPLQSADTYSAYHLYPILIKPNREGVSQRQVYEAMYAANIKVNVHYIPIYRQPYYETMGFNSGYCPEAERYYKQALSIPIYPTLTDAEQDQVIHFLHKILN